MDQKEWSKVLGKASCSNEVSGKCGVRFNKFAPVGDYRVVSTDYNDYAIVYSCSLILDVYTFELMWILSRKPYEPGSQ